MFDEQVRDTSQISMRLFRIAVIVAFLGIVGRLYQLQIVQGRSFQNESAANRTRLIEIPPARGVIYDRNGEILARNRPSFEIVLIPDSSDINASLPINDIETPDIDEEALAIEKLLMALRADQDESVALRIAEIMFRRLGRVDYANAVAGVGITLKTVTVPGPSETIVSDDGGSIIQRSSTVEVPDITVPLPLPALTALVKRAVELGRQGSSSEAIPILNLVDRIQAFEISEDAYELPGIKLEEVPVREYVYGELLSHVLGFMGPIPASLADEYREVRGYLNPNEKVGLSGLEFSYQDVLRGKPGVEEIEVNILGRKVRTVGDIQLPEPGQSLYLTIDRRLQKVMFDALSATMVELEAPWGVTIAMNPQDGAILGMVSLPTFDNNIFSEAIGEEYIALERDERRPLINYAIGGLYPPGSVFKLVPAAAALQEGIITAGTTIVDNGPIYLPNRFFPDDASQAQEFVSWNHKLGINHGPINAVQALALSNDIFFYLIGGGYPPTEFRGLGDDLLSLWAERFGYGEPTGIDLPGEVGVVIPDDQWKRQTWAERWTTGDSYNMAIGQGFLQATPLQVLVATAAIANGGKVLQPQLVDRITDADGNVVREYKPIVRRELPLDPETIEVVQRGMWSTVNSDFGTAALTGRVEGIEVAGKTGTAEFCEWDQELQDCRFRDDKGNLPTHAWYVSYAPYDAPEIAIVTFIYKGGEGSATAAPINQKILEAYFNVDNPNTIQEAP